MMHLRSSVVLFVLGLAACGGSSAPSGGSESSSSGGEHPHHERPRVPEIDALHDEIAPVFHAEASVRAAAACEHASALRDRSAAVHAIAAPAGVDAAAWSEVTTRLVSSADALGTSCTTGAPDVEARLAELHELFHVVMELSMGEHHDGDHHGCSCEHCQHEGGEHADCPCHHGEGEHGESEHGDCPCHHHDGDHDE